jgi:hypothetical protein
VEANSVSSPDYEIIMVPSISNFEMQLDFSRINKKTGNDQQEML